MDGLPGTWRLGSGPHQGDDPTVLIIVDTNDAGDRLKVVRGQQLQGVLGQEDPIHHAGDDLDELRILKVRSQTLSDATDIMHPFLVHPRMLTPTPEVLHLPHHGLVSIRTSSPVREAYRRLL